MTGKVGGFSGIDQANTINKEEDNFIQIDEADDSFDQGNGVFDNF